MLNGKHILIGITGSIAAYKIPYLVRLLVKEGAEVQILLTPSAVDFVTPLTLSTLTKRPVFIDGFNKSDGTWHNHVELGLWADLMLVAPASANTLAKMAYGIADNFLLSTYLSAKCPVLFAPAMDLDMYLHPATQDNIRRLAARGNFVIEPQVGELASGLTGPGRMEEPENILRLIIKQLTHKQELTGLRALVTAGPTYEAIDPVRFLGNRSSGLMGFTIAAELASRGADVTLISGPVALDTPPGIKQRIDVVSAAEMYAACHSLFDNADILVMSAAVADYRPLHLFGEKIKKQDSGMRLDLVPTDDILSSLTGSKRKDQFVVGFALETTNEKENALHKLRSKQLDLIVLNSLNDVGAGFGATNKVFIAAEDGHFTEYDAKPKADVASDIADHIVEGLRRNRIDTQPRK